MLSKYYSQPISSLMTRMGNVQQLQARLSKYMWSPMPTSTAVFTDVPDEVLAMITSKLKVKYLVNMALVNKRFHRVAQVDICKGRKKKRDTNGQIWLHRAVQNSDKTMVQRLLHVGADIHARDKDSLTPIYLAGRKRNAAIARILLSAQPDLVAFCQKDVGVLHAAAFLGNNSLFQRLLNAALPLIEPPEADEDDDNALALLMSPPAVDLRRVFESGLTLLHAAAFGGNVHIIQRVAELGGDVDRKKDSGVTPLHVAAYADNRLAVAKLVALGASVKKKDLVGRSAYSLAVGMGNHEAAEQLLIESDGRPLWGTRRRCAFPLD